jgi:hypothetical protein
VSIPNCWNAVYADREPKERRDDRLCLLDHRNFALVELSKGSTKFETITTSNTLDFAGSVQWDGIYLTVFDQDTNEMYQYTVSGTTAMRSARPFQGDNAKTVPPSFAPPAGVVP